MKNRRSTVPVVYWAAKLSHSGLSEYKVFENCDRKYHKNSLSNLLKSDQAPSTRNLSATQSRRVKSYCAKLAYYSATREFVSKRSGKYNFRVAFLTLTAPASACPGQILSAFEHFLDYLRRTANCVYVWKKELGDVGGFLHFHLLVNNFVPYYIVEWKWRRLLIAEGVEWPLNDKGKPTTSHYRIEIPRNRKQVAHYVAKYMSKAHQLPREMGFIAGHSAILDECKELREIMDDLPENELIALMQHAKVLRGEYIVHICIDLLKCGKWAPRIHALFEAQYVEFCEKITLPQRFYEC
jgi:hypothetical protein